MVFNFQITGTLANLSSEYKKLVEDIDISEISHNEIALPYQFSYDTGEKEGSKTMVLSSDGKIENDRRWFDDDPRQNIEVLIRSENENSLVFKGNKIYLFDDFKLGPELGTFSNPSLKLIRHVMPVNNRYILVAGDREEATYADDYLWQLDTQTIEKTILTKDPFYSFSRPPKIFMPEGFNGIVIIYYVGSHSFGFGGGSSVPKESVLRVYNNQYPEGQDLVRFYYKAGTIVDVKWNDNSLILTGDPSKPDGAEKYRKPARVWQVSF